MSTPAEQYAALVSAWADELRAGSTRTWAEFGGDFRATGTPAGTVRAHVPAAANLELHPQLLERLKAAAG